MNFYQFTFHFYFLHKNLSFRFFFLFDDIRVECPAATAFEMTAADNSARFLTEKGMQRKRLLQNENQNHVLVIGKTECVLTNQSLWHRIPNIIKPDDNNTYRISSIFNENLGKVHKML